MNADFVIVKSLDLFKDAVNLSIDECLKNPYIEIKYYTDASDLKEKMIYISSVTEEVICNLQHLKDFSIPGIQEKEVFCLTIKTNPIGDFAKILNEMTEEFKTAKEPITCEFMTSVKNCFDKLKLLNNVNNHSNINATWKVGDVANGQMFITLEPNE